MQKCISRIKSQGFATLQSRLDLKNSGSFLEQPVPFRRNNIKDKNWFI